MSLYFWWAVGFVYLGLLLCFTDMQLEPWFRKRLPARMAGSVSLLTLGVLFSLGVVFRSAPIDLDALIPPGEHADGALIAGVRWASAFTDLRIMLNNPGSIDYKDVEAVIEPDASIIHISEVTDSGIVFLGDVTREVVDIGGIIAKMPTITGPSGIVVGGVR